MSEHVAEENECCLWLGKAEIGSDEAVVKKCVGPSRSDEEVTIGS